MWRLPMHARHVCEEQAYEGPKAIVACISVRDMITAPLFANVSA